MTHQNISPGDEEWQTLAGLTLARLAPLNPWGGSLPLALTGLSDPEVWSLIWADLAGQVKRIRELAQVEARKRQAEAEAEGKKNA